MMHPCSKEESNGILVACLSPGLVKCLAHCCNNNNNNSACCCNNSTNQQQTATDQATSYFCFLLIPFKVTLVVSLAQVSQMSAGGFECKAPSLRSEHVQTKEVLLNNSNNLAIKKRINSNNKGKDHDNVDNGNDGSAGGWDFN